LARAAETSNSPSGFPQDALDLADGNAVDLGNLPGRHSACGSGLPFMTVSYASIAQISLSMASSFA
jgi:hypothetical protein